MSGATLDRSYLGEIFDSLADFRFTAPLRRHTPPVGWWPLGWHVDQPYLQLELSEETGEDGLPLWERPKAVPICDYSYLREDHCAHCLGHVPDWEEDA